MSAITMAIEAIRQAKRTLKNAKGKIHLAEEMADILEIFDLLLELNKLTIKDVKKVQRQKAKERGGFGALQNCGKPLHRGGA